VLTAAAADSLHEMTERLRKKLDGDPKHRDHAVVELLREVFTETTAVRFEGNNYSDEWKTEAARRGLPNLSDTPAALEAVMKPEHHAVLVRTGVLSQLEVDARFNVAAERYLKQVTLEAETLVDVLTTCVIPAVERQLATTGAAWRVWSEAAGSAKGSAYGRRVTALTSGLEAAQDGVGRIQALLESVRGSHDEVAACRTLGGKMRPLMQEVREVVDRLESLVDDEHWPLPKYREMLFVK
jgi:glutamine synthetase